MYIKSLHAIARILGESKVSIFGTGMREILRQILEKTALDSSDRKQSLRYSTLSLLNQIEEDEAECSRFVDSSTIKGLMSTLLDLESFIKSQTSVVGASRAPHRRDSMLQRTLEMVVHILKISANIARSNGKHYKSTIMRLNEDSASKTSIAINAKRIIDYGKITVFHLFLTWSSAYPLRSCHISLLSSSCSCLTFVWMHTEFCPGNLLFV